MRSILRPLVAAPFLLAAACGDSSTDAPAPEMVTGSQASALTTTSGFNPLPAGIQWTMAPRFPIDTDGDGVPNERFDAEYLRPAGGYSVTVNGCPAGDLRFQEQAYGRRFALFIDDVYRGSGCQLTTGLAQGTHRVRLTVEDESAANGVAYRAAEYTANLDVKDTLIVALGDSYGAGEGAPDRERQYAWETYWDEGTERQREILVGLEAWAERRCHRSFQAPAAQAAKALEERDPHTSVTFVSLACSGATISRETWQQDGHNDGFAWKGVSEGSGLLGPYKGAESPEGSAMLRAQVDVLTQLVGQKGAAGARTIDLLVMSAGGNDIGFGDVLTYCTTHVNCHEGDDGSRLRYELGKLRDALPSRYAALEARLATLSVRNTFLMEYPNFVRRDEANLCDELLEDTNLVDRDVSWGELTFLEPSAYGALQGIMKDAANAHGWNYVGGLERSFVQGHGMCTPARWVNTNTDARRKQGVLPDGMSSLGFLQISAISMGAAHPNREGYAVMAQRLQKYLLATDPALAPDGTLLRANGTTDVYVIRDGARELVQDLTADGFRPEDVLDVPLTTLERFPASALGGSGDHNGDGLADRSWVDLTTGQLVVQLSTGDGRFTEVRTDTSGWGAGWFYGARHFARGDYNGDGRTDWSWYAPWSNQFIVMLSDGQGHFRSLGTSTSGWGSNWSGARFFRTGDYNGDGLTDWSWYAPWSNAFIVMLSDGQGGFRSEQTSTSGWGSDWSGARFFSTGDYNGDGRTDWSWYAPWSNEFIVMLSDGQGHFRGVGTSTSGWGSNWSGARFFSTGDYNGDGLTDWSWYAPWSNQFIVMLSDGQGRFSSVGSSTSGWGADWSGGRFFSTGDFNGDGRTDWSWYAPWSRELLVMLSDGQGRFSSAKTALPAWGDASSVTRVWVGDHNGDGRDDWSWQSRGSAAPGVVHSIGDGTAQLGGQLPASMGESFDHQMGGGNSFWQGNGKAFTRVLDGRLAERTFVNGLYLWTDHRAPESGVLSAPMVLRPSGDKLFVSTKAGVLAENFWNPGAGQWQWRTDAAPPGTLLATGPFASQPEAPKFFVIGMEGALWERYWNPTDGTWRWTAHGTPPSVPALRAVTGARIGAGRILVQAMNGDVYERSWSQTTGTWLWSSRGRPSSTFVEMLADGVHSASSNKFFFRGKDGQVWELNYEPANPLGTNGWVWNSRGLIQGTTRAASRPTVMTSSARMFLTGSDGQLWELFWNGAAWAWRGHGRPAASTLQGDPMLVSTGDSSWNVLVRGRDRQLYVYAMNAVTNAWVSHGRPGSAPMPRTVLLRHERSGQCAYNAASDQVHHWNCWGDPGMAYTLDPVPAYGPDAVRLRHRLTNRCIYGNVNDGSIVNHRACVEDAGLVFQLRAAGGDRKRLVHQSSNRCLYSDGPDGKEMRNWACWEDPNMTFVLEDAAN